LRSIYEQLDRPLPPWYSSPFDGRLVDEYLETTLGVQPRRAWMFGWASRKKEVNNHVENRRDEENKNLMVGGVPLSAEVPESSLKRFLRCENSLADMDKAIKRPRPQGWKPNGPEVESAAQALHAMASQYSSMADPCSAWRW